MITKEEYEKMLRQRDTYMDIARLFGEALQIDIVRSQMLIWAMIAEMIEKTDKDGKRAEVNATDMIPYLMREMIGADIRDSLPLSIHKIARSTWTLRDTRPNLKEAVLLNSEDYRKEAEFARKIIVDDDIERLGDYWRELMARKDVSRIRTGIEAIQFFVEHIVPFAYNQFSVFLSVNGATEPIKGLASSKKALVRRLNAYVDRLELWIHFIKFDI